MINAGISTINLIPATIGAVVQAVINSLFSEPEEKTIRRANMI